MKSKKITSVLIILVMVMFVLSSCASYGNKDGAPVEINETPQEKETLVGYADYPYYVSLSDLEEKSDYIIYGKVLTKSYECISLRIKDNNEDEYLNSGEDVEDDLDLVTIFEVSITKSYKAAEDKNNVIKVLMLGGESEDTIIKYEGSPDIKVGGEYIFFLRKSAIVENGAWLLNNTQSLYCADDKTISCIAEGGFEISFEELDKMIEK